MFSVLLVKQHNLMNICIETQNNSSIFFISLPHIFLIF
ncbi:DUF5657 family protein [Thermoflexibacter ruber]